MKNISLILLIIALPYLSKSQSIGGTNTTVTAKGGFKADSALQIPVWDTSKIYTGKGTSATGAILVVNSLDGNLCLLKNGHWVEITGGGSGSITIGDPVSGGLDSAVLFLSASGTLAQSSSLTYGFNFRLKNEEIIEIDDLRETDRRGLLVTNITPATSDHPIQFSPAISMEGTGWDSFDGVSETQSIELYLLPDGENERPLMHADILIDGNRTTDIFSIGKTGQFTTPNGYKVQNGNIFNGDGLSLITGTAISYTNGDSGDRTSGTDTLSSGTKTVTTTAILTGDIVVIVGLSAATPCATCGALSLGTITGSTSFVVNSSLNTDSRLFRWFIVHHQ